jgi:broad specificity phosphatase PhoE
MILLVRHGETEFNRERRLQGHVDSPLTDLGVRQAQAVASLLADLVEREPAAEWVLVSSPLGRAHRTAEIIGGRLGLGVRLDERLMEMSWGERDGRLRSELDQLYPDTFGRSGWAFDAPGGESFEAVSARLRDWMDSLTPEPDRRVIAVSHGVSGRVLRGLYAGLSRERMGEQDVPQDAVYELRGGRLERHACGEVA